MDDPFFNGFVTHRKTLFPYDGEGDAAESSNMNKPRSGR